MMVMERGNAMNGAEMVECHGCGGTGTKSWGAVVNGKVTGSGECYCCRGKGTMTATDAKRDAYYHANVESRG
jgi:DnaJ-class molecular chaperone